MRDVLEIAVVGAAVVAPGRRGGRLRQQGIDLVDGHDRGTGQRDEAGDVAHALLRRQRRHPDGPGPTAGVVDVLRGVQIRLPDVLHAEVGGAEQDQRSQGVVRGAHGLRLHAVQCVDEDGQGLRGELVVARDRASVGPGHVRHRGELPQQLLELGLTFDGRPAEALQNAAARGLPEAGGVEELQQEEESTAGLHPLTHLAQQVGLARAGLATDHHAQRARLRRPVGVGEGVHDLLERPVVHTGHVEGAVGIPQVVGRRREGQTQRLEGCALLGIHHASIAIRCLSWSPMDTAAARSASVRTFWFSSGMRLTPGMRYILVSAASRS